MKKNRKVISILLVFVLALTYYPIGLVEAMGLTTDVGNTEVAPVITDVSHDSESITDTEVALHTTYSLEGATIDSENSKFQVSSDSGTTWTDVPGGTFNETTGTVTMTDLVPNTTYQYKAMVVSSDGVTTSEVTAEDTFTTLTHNSENNVTTVEETSTTSGSTGATAEEANSSEPVADYVIDVSNPEIIGPGYTFRDGVITFDTGAIGNTYELVGTTTVNRIVVEDGVDTTFVLNGVSITNDLSPIELQGDAQLGLYLQDETVNTVTCTGRYNLSADYLVAGICVPSRTTLTIDGTGTLNAQGGYGGAGIGGGYQSITEVGTIAIYDGTVTATGGDHGAGIGGGFGGEAGTIDIYGGTVTATGGDGGAGIGGGRVGGQTDVNEGTIVIHDGTVIATGGDYAAGIGGGDGDGYDDEYKGTITIEGGTVTATGGDYGAGIGSGNNASTSPPDEVDVTITGGTVTATGGQDGAGIGGGNSGNIGKVSISDTAIVKALSDGTRPAIEDVDGVNDAANPTSVVNASFASPVSTTQDTVLKFNNISENSNNVEANQVNEITLPANYKSFAFTTGNYNGEVDIEAYEPNGAHLGAVIEPDNSNVEASTSLLVEDVKVNYAPVAVDIPISSLTTTPEDISLTGTLVGSATDADGDTLTYAGDTTSAEGGIVAINHDGTYTYTPPLNYVGQDEFTFSVNDGVNEPDIATVTINVTPVNDVPVAENMTVSTTVDEPVTGTLKATDADGDALMYAVDTNSAEGGTVALNQNGAYTYTPAPGFVGEDSFTYTASDGKANSNVATVTIHVTGVNDAPVADNITVTTPEDKPITGILPATDADGDALTFTGDTTSAEGGIVVISSDGTYTYTPPRGYVGKDSFNFTASDGISSDEGTVTINVTNAPETDNITVTTPEDATLTGILPPTDVDGDPLTYTLDTTSAEGGTVVDNQDGTYTYTPAPGFVGTDTFTYTASDGKGNITVTTVTINVIPVNDAPVAESITVTTPEGTPLTGTLKATDVDGDALTYSGDAVTTQGGTVSINADGTFTYTPAPGFVGTDTFTFTANDGTVDSNVATVTINVLAENSVPPGSTDPIDGSSNGDNTDNTDNTDASNYSPETGDESNPFAYLAFALMLLVAIVFVFRKGANQGR